jgi:hypothetical protein
MKAITNKRISNVLYVFYALVVLYLITVSVSCTRTSCPAYSSMPFYKVDVPMFILKDNTYGTSVYKVNYVYLWEYKDYDIK